MARKRRNPGPSERDKDAITEENKQNDQSKDEDDQIEKKVPSSIPRVVPREAYCFSRTLNSNEMIPINLELFLEPNEALSLTDSPDSKILLVFDEDNRKYNMLFSHYITWQSIRYSISVDWGRFVTVHNLKAGDEISFYRFSDRNVCDGYYYILKFVRKSLDNKDDDGDAHNSEKPSDDAGQQVENKKKKKILPGPGSRPLPSSACCLSKTLTSHEVVQENSKLYFDPNDAIELTNFPETVLFPPGTYSRDLIVFDGDDRQYTMKLSHNNISGSRETSYCLNTGWRAFLVAHDLKEGDRLTFYRFFDRTVYSQDYYYVLKYFTVPNVDKSPYDIKNSQGTRRKLQCWTAKKKEAIALLELCELVEKEHEDGAQINEIIEEKKQNESSKVEDDQSEKKVPGTVPRVLPREVHCFSRTLNSNEVIPISPELFLTAYEARFLSRFPGSKILLVYDEDSRIYNMLFSHYVTWKCVQYSISVDWERFVRTHSLKAGDEISFYKILDRNVSDDCYYILKYVRKSQNSEKPSDDAGQQVEDKKIKINEPGPGSRLLTSEFLCLSKTLTSYEVVQENAKLYFDPNDAIILTNCPEIEHYPPGTYSKDLMVFDEDDRQYTMNLSHNNTSGAHQETSYSLNTGWRSFLRAHNLNEGDRLAFYRMKDISVHEDYYYVLMYFRKPTYIVDWVKKKRSEYDDGQKDSISKHNESDPNKVGKSPQKNDPQKKNTQLAPADGSWVPNACTGVATLINEITEENKQNESSRVEDDQSKEKAPRPVPRVLPHEVHCFSRTLNSNQVIPVNPELFLEDYEARSLTEFPGSKILLIYDEDSNIYNMLFSHYVTWECVQYSISLDWERFVMTHSLKAGDEISFYKILDQNISNDHYYILKYVRKPQNSEKISDDAGQQVEDKKTKINVPGPGSRLLTSEFLCLSKTLTSDEVVQENPKLYFDSKDAIILTNSPEIESYPLGTYSKDLMVFDEDDRQYTMNLSHNSTTEGHGETSYCLNTGWRAFLRAHNLKEGDRLAFYRMKDRSVQEDYYYVVMYFRKPAHIVDYQFRKKPISDDYGQKDSMSETEPNKGKNASVSPDKRQDSEVKDNAVCDGKTKSAQVNDDDGQKYSMGETEPNKGKNASVSPGKREDPEVKDNAVCDGKTKSAQVSAGGSWVPSGGVTALASLLELRLEAEIEEAERQVEYWKAKKSEAVDLLELCRVLAKGEH